MHYVADIFREDLLLRVIFGHTALNLALDIRVLLIPTLDLRVLDSLQAAED